jgi:hypothetical protein
MTAEVLERTEVTEAEEVARQMLDGDLPVVEEEERILRIGNYELPVEEWTQALETLKQPKPEPNYIAGDLFEPFWFDRAGPYVNDMDWGETPEVGAEHRYQYGYCGPHRGGVYTGGPPERLGWFDDTPSVDGDRITYRGFQHYATGHYIPQERIDFTRNGDGFGRLAKVEEKIRAENA